MTKDKVIALLDAQSIDWSKWGSNGSKTVDELVDELGQEEMHLTFLPDNTLGLLILGVGVRVLYQRDSTLFMLREGEQLFSNGARVVKDYENSIGEKMKRGESPEAAARRGLEEELGFTAAQLKACEIKYEQYKIRGPIPAGSYPGLLANYRYWVYSVLLPQKLFRARGYREKRADKVTCFHWTPVPA